MEGYPMTPKPDEAIPAANAVERAKAHEYEKHMQRVLRIPRLYGLGEQDAAALAAVLARLTEYEKDAARLDWLESRNVPVWNNGYYWGVYGSGWQRTIRKCIDDAIDTAKMLAAWTDAGSE